MSAATAMSPVRDRRRSDQRARLQAMREGGQPGQTSGRTRKWRRRLLRRTPIAIAAVSAAGWSYETNLKTNPNYTRMNAALLTTSERMRKALAQEEGMRLTVYRDVAGYPTVGIGHLVLPEDGLRVGDRITREQAMDFLAADLAKAERAVADVVGNLKLYQHEFDALVDLAYNVGEGTLSPAKSPALNRAIASADYEGIAQELDYRFADGQVAGGLVHRSERRAQIFLEADYADVRPG